MRLPAGVRDWLPHELARKRALEATIRGVFERWRYAEVMTPGFERFDVIEAGLGEELTEKTFRFSDRRANTLALRPEMTTPIARLVSTRMRGEKLPLRLSYVAPAYRFEQPQQGRMQEFTQAGVELIGARGVEADSEMLLMALETLDAIGLNDARFDINDAAIVDGVLDGLGIHGDAAHRCKILIAERNIAALRAQFPAEVAELAMLRGDEHVFATVRRLCRTPRSLEALERLHAIRGRAIERGYGERVAIDFALLRDLEYYTGFVFEGYVRELGYAVCGGGRYDTLLPRMGFDAPAVGWAVGVERLLIALERRNAPAAHQFTFDGLTIAIPKGLLYEESVRRLRAAGLDVPDDPGRRLVIETADQKNRFLFLRPTDVPAYVEFGAADCGIVGADVLWEVDRYVSELADLGFGLCRLVVAGRRADGYHEGAPLPTFLRVATKFTRSAEAYFSERDLPAEIISLHGSVELSPLVGLADLIVDLVATGKTLREHDLVVVDEIAPSTARFVVNPIRFRTKYDALKTLLANLQGSAAAAK
jgi:ATP phosphoribosyltransferase